MVEFGNHDLKLYSGPLSMFGAKAEIAIREKASRSISKWSRSPDPMP